MTLAREGYPFVAAGALLAILVHGFAGGAWALPMWIITIFMLQFFRDPVRVIPPDSGVVVSPADGKVVTISKSKNPYSGVDAICIAIFLDIFSVHSTRIPVSGLVLERLYNQGKFLHAAVDKASEENERNALIIRTKDSQEVACVQIAGLIARRILCYVQEGDNVSLGQRYGFIRFGSRVELFLPVDYKVSIGVGDKVKGGSDVIGLQS